ncbi:CcmD family protein [Mucilaginibacter sp. Bleaf8]|uniref:CcmD family protein n=1 Tax=Mucilaginibacter sp. Bleaf8 TaxID=2834430 RepID=UPI001BCE11E6|nr:CcmD family protein [Mucilaginibacter sp. Bleaf8]MBS7563379.1 CcmD family protein [Mucilaginibacter sp. Bleaf8]
MKKLVSLALLLFCFVCVHAQPVDMADQLRSSGKIYVVIGTIAIVFAGLAVYLFSIDRRLKKVERED